MNLAVQTIAGSDARPIVTYIWGRLATGKTTLARKLAAERQQQSYETAIVDRSDESVDALMKRHQVNYLYICSLEPPRTHERIFIATEIPLKSKAAA